MEDAKSRDYAPKEWRWLRPGLLRRHNSLVEGTVRAADVACVLAAGYLTEVVLCSEPVAALLGFPVWYLAMAVTAGLAAILFGPMGLYRPWRGVEVAEEARAIANAILLVFGAVFTAAAVLAPTVLLPPASWWLVWSGASLGLLALTRLARRLVLYWFRGQGFNQRHVALLGTGPLARDVAQALQERRWNGLRVAGFIRETPGSAERTGGLPVLGSVHALGELAHRAAIDDVWVACDLSDAELRALVRVLDHTAVQLRLIVSGPALARSRVNRIAGVPVVNLSASPITGINRVLKAVEDYLLAALMVVVLSPFMVAIAVAVKLSSPGPIFYRQERLTREGRPFCMLKFRSMPVGVEDRTGAIWARAGDGRATAVGAFLRRTSLDELPQLFNVLAGHMSIVGPRPERPVFVGRFKHDVPGYMRKHLVKAGITGWAQVNGWRGDTDLAQRIAHDLYYIENWSIWLDLKIVALTPLRGLVHQNAY
jgi:putative colanic acid biosynthesis UDP-glucose lipid carrier transferase